MDKVILGIDPGTRTIGYGVLSKSQNKISVINYGIINIYGTFSINKYSLIYNEVNELIHDYKPDCVVIESQFLGINVQSLIKLSRIQGIIILAAINNDIKIKEYSPTEIKKHITGIGNASKIMVSQVLQSIFKINFKKTKHDATDALAIAYTECLNNKIILDK